MGFIVGLLLLLIGTVRTAQANFQQVHILMDSQELQHHFGVESHHQVGPYELTSVRRKRSTDDPSSDDGFVHFQFSAFGKDYDLPFQINRWLAAPQMKTVKRTASGEIVELDPVPEPDCHWLHTSSEVVASITHCNSDHVTAFLVDQHRSIAMEIRPLSPRLRHLVAVEGNHDIGPHLIRPVTHPQRKNGTQSTSVVDQVVRLLEKRGKVRSEPKQSPKSKTPAGKAAASRVLEVGLFVDEAAYKILLPYLGNDDQKLRELMLGYVNAVQTLYSLDSLGTQIDFAVVYMELQQTQPADLPTYQGERSQLLNSFCAYQKKLNPVNDAQPNHWDIALYISGLDFFAVENGTRNYITMGLSPLNGICTSNQNCVIGEFGVVSGTGKPYPSTGFASTYVIAHEIGHNLGMLHDGGTTGCTQEGFIMSPSRGVAGETKWSNCSKQTMVKAKSTCLYDIPAPAPASTNHNKYRNAPGQFWGADDQCQLLLRDKQASLYDISSLDYVCSSLKCKTPNRDGFYLAGPALDGTLCAASKWCVDGSCVDANTTSLGPEVIGGWSDWIQEDQCRSGCTVRGRGIQISRRFCNQPTPLNTLGTCDGPSNRVSFCNDTNICGASRLNITAYATKKCRDFSRLIPTLVPSGPGLQALYSPDRPWQSCAIYCKRNDTGLFYTPRLDLNDLPDQNAYFPDGTWCGKSAVQNYYCMQNLCVPGAGPFDRNLNGNSVELETQSEFEFLNNAPLTNEKEKWPMEILEYFMVDESGQPVRTEVDFDVHTTPISNSLETGQEDLGDFFVNKPKN